MKTIDLTPSWTSACRVLIEGIKSAARTGKHLPGAEQELLRMADLADQFVAFSRKGGQTRGSTKARSREQAQAAARARWDRVKEVQS